MGQGLLVGPGPASALYNLLWNTLERGWDAVALGTVPSGPHKGTLGTSEIQMVVSTEVLFLATLCSLLPLWGWKDLGSEEGSVPLWTSQRTLFTVTAHSFSQWLD